jgi:phage terminase large subunit-like protein
MSPQRLIDGQLPPTAGPLVCRFMESFLVHGEGDALGQPIRLDPFQRYILNRKWEYHPLTGRLLYDRTLFGMAKGNAKTELMGLDANTRLGGPIAPLSPNIPMAAASWEQANRMFGAARLALEEGPLAEAFKGHIFEDRITHPDRPGVLSRIAAIAGTNDGGLPSDVYEDELHEWEGERRERVDVVLGNSLHKRSPRAVLPDGTVLIGGQQNRISTAGDNPDSLLKRLYDHGRKVATGEIEDPSFLFLWWEAGDEHDLDTEDGLTAAILEANPAAGSFLSIENLVARFKDPTLARYEFERYHLNRWVSAPDAWIALDRWMGRRDPAGLIWPKAGSIVWLGFDGSKSRDSTALVGCTAAGHVFVIKVWERDQRNPDWTVPRAEVDDAVRDAFKRWDVKLMQCDPPRWEREIDDWADLYGKTRVLAFDTFVYERMAKAVGRFHDAVMDGTLTHDGDPVLARHVANARSYETRWGLVIKKEHKDSPRRIDAAVAAVLAHDGITAPEKIDRTLHLSSLR